MKTVVYALDAGGVNNVGWVRVHKCPGDINNYIPIVTQDIDKIIDHSSVNGIDYTSGDNLKTLSNLIYNDLKEGNLIAIGVEAPMWFPISPTDSDYRFIEERKSSWSGQIGSTVSVQGIKISLNLFDLLSKLENVKFSTTTEYNHWVNEKEGSKIFLFEGFISGDDYKIPCINNSAIRNLSSRPINPKTNERYSIAYKEEHRWDAFLIACAFYGYYYGSNLGTSYQGIKFTPRYSEVLSHWHSIMRRFSISITPVQDCPCSILAVTT